MGLDWAVSAGYLHLNQGPGTAALKAFSEAFGVETADEAITLACRGLRAKVEAAGWDITLPSFVKAFGLRVLEAPITQAGRLDFEDGRYVIRIKAFEPSSRGDREIDPTLLRGRQRFSVAHELGHALLLQTLMERRDLLPGLRDPDEWERIESLCDQAAAELLVPMESFIAGVQRRGVSPESLDGLAQDFAVSREVILRRFLDGGARTAAIWRVRNIPGKGPLGTVRSAVSGPMGPYLRTGVNSRSLAPNIVLRAAMRGRAQSAKLKLTSGPASWSLAGVAEARNPIQPSGPTQEAEILLLLFHEAAPAAKEPLWSAAASRRTH